jgi:hypothetical protein
MAPEITVSEETRRELDAHRTEDETYDELLRELVQIYEQQGTFTREGYSE